MKVGDCALARERSSRQPSPTRVEQRLLGTSLTGCNWPVNDAHTQRPTVHFSQIANLHQADPAVRNAVRAVAQASPVDRFFVAEFCLRVDAARRRQRFTLPSFKPQGQAEVVGPPIGSVSAVCRQPVGSTTGARPTPAFLHSLKRPRGPCALVARAHVDDHDPGLALRLHMAVGIRDGLERIRPINHRARNLPACMRAFKPV
jgi:hypothetical protein